MTTKHFNRPSGSYTGEAGLTYRTKYQDDSAAVPKVAISSSKIDGDVNYLIDAVNTLYDTAVSSVIPDNSITDAKIRQGAAYTVIGRASNSTGNVADIAAANDGEVLRRNGTTLGFGTLSSTAYGAGTVTTTALGDGSVTTAKIGDSNVTTAKIADSQVTTAKIADANVTTAKLATTGVTAASYTYSSVTVNAQGQVTAASSGTAPVFTKSYDSGNQTVTNAGSLTLAHGLGTQPLLYLAVLKCTSSEANYSTGDEVAIAMKDNNGAGGGVSLVPDGTNINVRFGSNFTTAAVLDKTSGAQANITAGNWRLIVRAWA